MHLSSEGSFGLRKSCPEVRRPTFWWFCVNPGVKLQLRNRFIHVGVDISSYALLIGGRSSYPPVLVKLLYPRVLVYKWSISGLYKCYIGLPSARLCAVWVENNKVHVCTPSIVAGLKCPPPSTTISQSPGLRSSEHAKRKGLLEGLRRPSAFKPGTLDETVSFLYGMKN